MASLNTPGVKGQCVVVDGTLHLCQPRYWLRREVSDMPKFELPPPEKVRKLELPICRRTDGPALDPSSVAVLDLVYGRTFLAHRDARIAR